MPHDRQTKPEIPDEPPSPVAAAGQTTLLLRRLGEGDSEAGDALFELVQDELHRLANHLMSPDPSHTLQPTALVHEAWLRMAGGERTSFGDRAHFVRVAAKAMRHTLVDHARRKRAAKRGGGAEREPLDLVVECFEESAADLLALDEALERLGALDPQLVQIVERRFFAQASNAEIAAGLGVSERTVERGWKVARVFLRTELSEDDDPQPGHDPDEK